MTPTIADLRAADAVLDFLEAVMRRQHEEGASDYTRESLLALARVRRLAVIAGYGLSGSSKEGAQ